MQPYCLKGQVVCWTVRGNMHLKDILGSIAREGYWFPVPDFRLVLNSLRCRKSTLMDYNGTPFERPPRQEATPSGKATLQCKSKHKLNWFLPLTKGHSSWKATLLVQKGWPHKRGSTVITTTANTEQHSANTVLLYLVHWVCMLPTLCRSCSWVRTWSRLHREDWCSSAAARTYHHPV